MVLLLTGFHLILPHVLRQSPSKIPLHLTQICLVVYLKVPSLAHFFSLYIQLPLALSSLRTQSNTTAMLMTPSYTSLSLLQTQLLHENTFQNFIYFFNYLFSDILSWMNSAQNLGFIFDSDMSFPDQINSLSKSCHFHIRDIRHIRHLLPLSAATALADSLVSSKLDYCNSLYNGISQAYLNKIQCIQNTLARVSYKYIKI